MMSSSKKTSDRRYFKHTYQVIHHSIVDTIKHDGIEHAGYLAFLFILSLFPFIIFLASITSQLGSSTSLLEIIELFLKTLPSEIFGSLEPRINEIITGPPQSLVTIAIIGIIWTASSNVEGMKTILNRAYRVEKSPPYIMGRMLSILQFFVIILTVILAMVLLILFPAIMKKIEAIFLISFKIDYDWLYLRQLIVFGILLIGTSLLYYLIPDSEQRFTDVLPGSVLCVFIWTTILKLFTIYLERFNQFNLLYGSLGGIIGSLMFFYLVNLVFIFGAEFNYHFKRVYDR